MKKMKKNVWFVVNPISGTSDKQRIVDLIPQYLPASDFRVRVCYTQYSGHAAEIAHAAVSGHVDVVVAVGGDGTVNEVARSLIHTDTALGIVPCGSGNGLARHLSIPLSPEGALQVIGGCVIGEMDYGRINGTPFFCTCGVGFDAFVSSKFAESGRRGLLSYIENTLKEGLQYRPETYDIEIDDENGEHIHCNAFLIACANASQYGNNVYIAPSASMSDGLMDITIMQPFTVLEAPQIAIQLFRGTIGHNSRIQTFRCRYLTIHRKQPGVIHFDGDPKQESADLEIELVPHDIRMVINPQQKAVPAPLLQMFTDLYNGVNAEWMQLRQDLRETPRRIRTINKELLKKLRPQ